MSCESTGQELLDYSDRNEETFQNKRLEALQFSTKEQETFIGCISLINNCLLILHTSRRDFLENSSTDGSKVHNFPKFDSCWSNFSWPATYKYNF